MSKSSVVENGNYVFRFLSFCLSVCLLCESIMRACVFVNAYTYMFFVSECECVCVCVCVVCV